MSVEQVWLRFEKKRKDGTIWNLRIQDVPLARLDEVIELKVKYYARDEVTHKALGVTKNPAAVKQYTKYSHMTMRDPACRTVICCEDSGDEVGDIIGISSACVGKKALNWDEIMIKDTVTPELKKLIEVDAAISTMFNPVKELNVSNYLHAMSILVVPEYRGYGITQHFLRTRRLICAALDIPLTGGWMATFGTQVAATRDGWKTIFEVKYEDLALTHDIAFEDAPPTLKYMVSGPLHY